MTYHNYLAIVGRLHGDDEDHVRLYKHMTLVDARQAFINDVRNDGDVSEEDVVAEYECASVYITNVLTSETPIQEN